jgi:hypothetical protein
MITIFYDFPQFSAKKFAFFLNTNVTIKLFFKFGFVLSQKLQLFFRKIFRRKYFKKSVPGRPRCPSTTATTATPT